LAWLVVRRKTAFHSPNRQNAGARAIGQKHLAASARAVTAPGMAVIGSDMFAHMPLIMIDKMLRSF
jgi:hypothetical protein